MQDNLGKCPQDKAGQKQHLAHGEHQRGFVVEHGELCVNNSIITLDM